MNPYYLTKLARLLVTALLFGVASRLGEQATDSFFKRAKKGKKNKKAS